MIKQIKFPFSTKNREQSFCDIKHQIDEVIPNNSVLENIEIDNQEKKSINIIGKTNRYEIKKRTQDKVVKYKKTLCDSNYFENQYQQLLDIENGVSKNSKPILKELDKKLAGYKQQDILKKRFNNNDFITMDDMIKKILKFKLKCYYCSNNVLILFDIVRELNQWTLDRVDNSLSHTDKNTVISCLQCNLKRKTQNSDSFLFTKNLNITKA